ncbi:hypothetical protein LMG26854_03318 [Achromobacter aegrifaciens]|uniref:hypothetical protein n=1 Tax=Achromobacter aegrifaciens TaxID=1287736 RepID=UPI0014690B0D|nr:hypothetical protein [Achromobacter aegrifaciens]CAB3858039.1 hypothetical protein LMG26854_03318 [Achromobacter aegrifaciens]
MTISSTTRKAGPFFGNDATIDFPFTFKVFKKQDVRVTLTDPTGADQVLLLDSSYSVTLNTDQDSNPGGTVRYPVLGSPLPATWRLTVTGGLPNTQPTDIQNNGGFYPQIVEDMGDRSTIQIQQLQEQVDRSLKFSISDSGAGAVLPPADLRANKMLGFDAAGIPTTLIPASGSAAEVALALASFINSLANSTDTVQGSALVGGVSRIVSTIAELRNQRGDKNPYVTAIGYYARGDKSPAFYFYDPTDGVSADNGGTVIVTQLGHRYKLNHRGFVSIDDFGARGNGVADDSARIQAAFDWASVSKVPLTASARTYGLALSQRIAMEGWNQTYCCLVFKSYVRIQGAGKGKTIFKLLDNQSSDASPKWFNMMSANTVVEYPYIDGITFDINGQNNKINPGRGAGLFDGFNCAALMVSGSVASVGVDAGTRYLNFTNNQVINSPGVTCIATGQRNGPGTVIKNTGYIGNCDFLNNGLDSQDHSSIFAFGDDITMRDCWFKFPTPSTGRFGPVVAVEMHGSNIQMINCHVENYCQMAWLVHGPDGMRRNQSVLNCTGKVTHKGIGLFSSATWNGGLSDLFVLGNQIEITGDLIVNPHLIGTKYAFYFASGHGANVYRLTAADNLGYCSDTTDNAGMVWGADTDTIMQEAFDINNHFSGFSRGVIVGGGGGGRLLVYKQVGLSVQNCRATPVVPTANTRGLLITGINYTLDISNPTIGSGDILSAPPVAIEMSGSATNLHLEGVSAMDCPVDVLDGITVSGYRTGTFARRFNALPAQSTWKAGDVAYLAVPSEAGVAGSKVMTNGWRRITNGAGNVLNTDWLEMRTLTGN